MKKIIFGLVTIFALTLSVLAGDNTQIKIVLKDIKLSNYQVAPFEGNLEVNYELVPNDIENKEVVWTISGIQKGVTAEIVDSSKTNKAVGTLVLKIKNTNEKESTINLTAKSGKISKVVSIKIENQTVTEDRYKKEVVEQIEGLIKDIKKIDSKNEAAIEKAIDKIEVMLKNEEVKKSVDKDLLEDFDQVKKEYEAYKNEDKTDYSKIAIIVALILAFLFGLYMIFKDNTKQVKKTETKTKSNKKNK